MKDIEENFRDIKENLVRTGGELEKELWRISRGLQEKSRRKIEELEKNQNIFYRTAKCKCMCDKKKGKKHLDGKILHDNFRPYLSENKRISMLNLKFPKSQGNNPGLSSSNVL